MNLIFRSRGELRSLAITEVREVIKPQSLTQLPFVPPKILGVFSLRGTLVTVVNETTGEGNEENVIVVLNRPPYQVGILVDKVIEVREETKGAREFNVHEVMKAWNASA